MIDRYQFGEEFQLGILALMVQDPYFAVNYSEVIKPVYFSTEYAQDMCTVIQDFIATRSCVPTKIVLVEEVKRFTASEARKEMKEFYLELAESLFSIDIERDGEYIKSEVIDFGRAAAIRNAMLKMSDPKTDLLNKREFDKMQDIFNKAYMVGMGVEDLGYDYYDTVEERSEQYMLPTERGIPTGIPGLDRCLEGGGVHPGWLCFVMAPTGVGKSIALLTFAKHAALNRLKVLYISTEMTEKALSGRLDRMNTGLTQQDLRSGEHKQELVDKIKALKTMGGRVKIKFFPKKTANANKIRALIDKLKSVENFVPDLIVVDYADEMIANNPSKDLRIDSMNIFVELNSLGQQIGVPVWTATQANGAGYSLQREKKNLDVDNASESKSKSHGADVILSLVNVEKNEDGTGILQMGLIKNRDGISGITIMCEMDYNTMIMTATSKQISAAKEEKATKETKAILDDFSKFNLEEDPR